MHFHTNHQPLIIAILSRVAQGKISHSSELNIQHVPDVSFCMIRHYGFLAHCMRRKILPIVYKLLGQKNDGPIPSLTYAELIQKNFNFNPLICILCGNPLLLTAVRFGVSKISDLINLHRPLALLQKI